MVGISFKISKSGTRYIPKLSTARTQKNGVAAEPNKAQNGVASPAPQSNFASQPELATSNLKPSVLEGRDAVNIPYSKKARGEAAPLSTEGDTLYYQQSLDPLARHVPNGAEVSFAVNLFPSGFSIDKPTEKGKLPPLAFEVMDLLLPYDRTTESFLRAIDGGWIPGDLLEEIPCKYIDGCVVCELRDYRDSVPSSTGDSVPALSWKGMEGDWIPVVHRVLLHPTTETIVKDIASMADASWTYKDFMEVEARVLNAVRPPLCLDPTPEVAKQAYITNYNKLKYNIGCPVVRRYRTPKGAFRERRLRIAAAAKALSKADLLAKRRNLNLENTSVLAGVPGASPSNGDLLPASQDSPAADLSPGIHARAAEAAKFCSHAAPGVLQIPHPISSQSSLGQQASIPRAGGLTHSLSALSIPSVPLSPSSSAPATPATPSTVTSASGHEVTSGLGGASSMLGRRESKESAAAARAEAKRVKAEQAKMEKAQQQQRKLQERQDAKELKEKQRKEKLQQHQQQKIEKQQMSRSNSHLSLVSQHSGSMSLGDGGSTPRSDNKSLPPMGDQKEVADMKPKIEQQETSLLMDHALYKGAEVRRPKVETEVQMLEEADKVRQEQEKPEAEKEHCHSEQVPAQEPSLFSPLPPARVLVPQAPRPQAMPSQLQWQNLGSPRVAMDVKPDVKAEMERKMNEDMLNCKELQGGVQIQEPGRPDTRPPTLSLKPGLVTQVSLPPSGISMGTGVLGVSLAANHAMAPQSGPIAAISSMEKLHALASNLPPTGGSGHIDQHSLAQSRQRASSLSKAHGVAPLGTLTTGPMQSAGVNSPSAPASGSLASPGVKVERGTVGQLSVVPPNQLNEDGIDTMKALVSAIQRHGLHNTKRPIENLPPPNKTPPSFHMLSVALSETSDDVKEPIGHRSMANSLVGGNINSRKTRSLLFVKTEPKPNQSFQAGMNFQQTVHRSRKRLVLIGRAKDSLVEAIIQIGDDQEEEGSTAVPPPHHVLPTMANAVSDVLVANVVQHTSGNTSKNSAGTGIARVLLEGVKAPPGPCLHRSARHVADRFAKQYCALLKKEGYELVSDEVQQSAPRNPVVNAASNARPMPAGASTLGNPQVGHLGTAQRTGLNPQLMQGGMTLTPMQPSSPSQLAANRMPPPSNAPSRQLMTTHMGQQGITAAAAKPNQMEFVQASQLAAAQQQQHHQLQQQQAQLQRQPPGQQQQLVAASQLAAQLTGQAHNSVTPQMVAQSNQLQQLQYLHQHQQARQHQQHQHMLNQQRKVLLPGGMGNSLTGMGTMSGGGIPVSGGGQASLGNIVNLGGMSNAGMAGMSGITSMGGSMAGMSSLGGMSGPGNMGQLGAMGGMGQQGNLLNQQLRSGSLSQAQAAALQSTKTQQFANPGRGRPGPVVVPNSGGRTQADALSGLGGPNQGVSMMGQGLNRSSLAPIQRAPVTGLAPSKLATGSMPGQSYYLNSPHLNSQQQQLKGQQMNAQQMNAQQMNAQQLNAQQMSAQQLNAAQQQQLSSSQQINTQQMNAQQLNSQQLNSQPLNPQQLNAQQQLNVGSLSSLVGGPGSPQLSGQSLGSIANMTVSSSMDMQNATRAAAAAGRAPVVQPRRPTLPQPGQAGQPGQPSQSQ